MKYTIQERMLMAMLFCRDVETACRRDSNFLILLDDAIESKRMNPYWDSLCENGVIQNNSLHPSKIPLAKALTRFRDLPQDMTDNFLFYTFNEMCKELRGRILDNPELLANFGDSLNSSLEVLNDLIKEIKSDEQ